MGAGGLGGGWVVVALLSGTCLSFWLTRLSPWATHTLAAENAALRRHLREAQAANCREQAEKHAAALTAVLAHQVEERDLIIRALEAKIANMTMRQRANQGAAGDNTVECASPFHAVAPFQPRHMREVLDWESFDRGYVYSWRRYWRVNGHQGNLRRELQEAITASKQYLSDKTFAWQHGQFQLDTKRGITYLMDFEKKGPHGTKIFHRIRMYRPISSTVYPFPVKYAGDQQNRTIHLVLPLQGRLKAFEDFLDRISSVAGSPEDPPLRLTVVYYENTARQANSTTAAQVDRIMKRSSARTGLHYTLLVKKNEPFTRGRALQYGANAGPPPPPPPPHTPEEALFFCDVDMKFTREFLYRCRANAAPGYSVYFPIPFSVYRGHNTSVMHENGEWRKYGLGMVCISRSDFSASKGYSTTITGWGREDVDFYERTLKNASLQVMRAVDEGLVHIWHPKDCPSKELSQDQMQDCIQSQADWEGDKLHLARELAKYRAHCDKPK